jgi:hypothetical protein
MDGGAGNCYRAGTMSLFRRPGRILLCLCALLAGVSLGARDVFVMLSGGASPTANNYSQYLQARAVAKFFRDRYPADSVWTFFGAGNVEGQPAVFGDVRKQYKQDGLILESWLPGPLPHNRPAKRETVLKALREEILPAVRDGGTLYLFVGDHGSTTRTGGYDTTIDLWGIDPDPASPRKWKSVQHEKLTVADLQAELAQGLGRGRVVFCMTQCYSGGFHFLGVPRAVAPNSAWFEGFVPDWAMPGEDEKLPRAAGFSAADHYSLAAGCDPDPDPDRWAGYERFAAENLLGVDLFTLQAAGKARGSFFEAHIEATLEDQTIDKPHSTSERYLERWATTIEKLAKEPNLTPAVRKAADNYAKAVDTGKVKTRDAALRERQKLFERFTKQLAKQAPSAGQTLLKGNRAALEKLAGALPPGANFERPAQPERSPRQPNAENVRLWQETLRPAWKAVVEAGEIPALAHKGALAFEMNLLAGDERPQEAKRPSSANNPPTEAIFWATGAHDPPTYDAAGAEAVARWGALRRRTIAEWARQSENAEVKAAAEKLFPQRRRDNPPAAQPAQTTTPSRANQPAANRGPRPLQPKIAAERVLLYRRVLAAWSFLLEVKEQGALDEVRALTELERTPLPKGWSQRGS